MEVLRKQGVLDNPEKMGRKKLVQCSERTTDMLPMPVTAQHCLISPLGTSVVSAAGAPVPAWKERGAVCSSQQESHVSSQGECWYVPLGNTHLPSAWIHCTRAALPLCASPGSQGRDNPAGARHRTELLLLPEEPSLLTPTLGHPGSVVPAGEECPRSTRKGWAEAGLCQPGPSAPSSPCSAPRKSGMAREVQGTGTRAARGSLPLEPLAPRLGLPLTPELRQQLKQKLALHWKRAAGLLQTPQRLGRGNSEPVLQQGCGEGPDSAESCCLPAVPGTAELRAVWGQRGAEAPAQGCACSRPLG